ncbi:MAG: methyltransferase domain-containing protein [Chloroflexi bacterium]|nr:methyltransferase domain-containing protein [Chloroflexota bacterium]MCI0577264.1 methyltransferase domain-containing protein [Chloroflexota bacterium]MCI0648209.1 methyltransferase domain-containing protein [Chloroflexota bacterium]MCI0730148.1 methyltransferase domain-containing protein [Chloroflexota bacterium]
MSTPAAIFDDHIPQWLEEQRTPWARLKYTVTQANLRHHLPAGPLRILDAGGGNGFDSIPLAKEGHHITIVDYSAAMLAEARQNAAASQVAERISIHLAEMAALPELFPQPCFDVVLCHNVLQYTGDVAVFLAAVAAPLKPGGLLSLISVNRYSIPYRAAFFQGDLAGAYEQLDQRMILTTIFGEPMTMYTAEEIMALLPSAGCVPIQDYGIRCVCDYWGDNERKSDPAVFAELERLELALSGRHPYKLLARYFQIIARKLSPSE